MLNQPTDSDMALQSHSHSPGISPLGDPLRIGDTTLRNRIVSAPMERNYCDHDGHVTPLYCDYVANRAQGGAALVFTEATYVRQDGKSRARQMGLSTDAHIVGVKEMARRVHDAGALLGIELNHGGRTARSAVSGLPPVAPSPLPLASPGAEIPRSLDVDDIADIVRCFGDAARRCAEADVDVISIHAAHGYLIQAFMSPATNHRDDDYADPRRFLTEVVDAVRGAAPHLALGLRISAFEGNPGGLTPDQQLEILEPVMGKLDFIDVSAGNYEAPQWSVQPAEFERGLLASYAAAYKRFGIPVGVAGRINDPHTANDILSRGDADFISMARALHADAHFPQRVLNNQQYRPCIACNLCADELASGEPIRCSVNVRVHQAGREAIAHDITPTAGRVLVIGAGPVGIETACQLAEAGVEVTLVDERDHIGGQFRLAAGLTGVPEYRRLLRWYEGRLQRCAVNLKLGHTLDPDLTELESYDAIAVATGAVGNPAPFPGANYTHEIRAWLADNHPAPEQVTIIGGDREALAVGYDLARRGCAVEIIAEETDIGLDVGRRAKILSLPYLHSHDRVTLYLETHVESITPDAINVIGPQGSATLHRPEVVLTTLGAQRRTEALSLLSTYTGTTPIIDAGGPNETVWEAISAARNMVEKIISTLHKQKTQNQKSLAVQGANS